jgi:hypothetical protein
VECFRLRWGCESRRAGRESHFAGQIKTAMVPLRIIAFLLLAACGALCQQGREKRAWSSLPDAPSLQASAQAETLRTVAGVAGSPLILGAVGANGGVTRESELANVTRATQPGFSLLYAVEPIQNESGDFLGRYLYPSLLKRNLNYRPSSSGSWMGRATYAASRIFLTRDDSGRGRLNTSYFLGVLSLAAMHTAYRPYWRRGISEPFSDFGSTIGNDAGMNLFHEFGPGLQQLMKSHAPKFVSRIEERLGASAR